jgi:hypothetical protein
MQIARQAPNVSQEMGSVASQMQRMASDHTKLLKKFFAHQEKQARRAPQRAAQGVRIAVNKARALQQQMMLMMMAMSTSQSSSKSIHTKSSANKSSTANYKKEFKPTRYTNNKCLSATPSERHTSNSKEHSNTKLMDRKYHSNKPPCTPRNNKESSMQNHANQELSMRNTDNA